jgi:hypothetical protein
VVVEEIDVVVEEIDVESLWIRWCGRRAWATWSSRRSTW